MASEANLLRRILSRIAIIIALAAVSFWFFQPPATPPGKGDQQANGEQSGDEQAGAGDASSSTTPAVDNPAMKPFTIEQHRVAIEAVAATEEADFDRARKLWVQLSQAFPDDANIATNEAVAVLKWIVGIEELLNKNDGSISPERLVELNEELETAYQYSERITNGLAELNNGDFRVPFIRAKILESQANHVQYPADLANRQQAAEILDEALSIDPAQPILVALFDHLVRTLVGAVPELEAKRADYLYAGFLAQPDNLFLLKEAATELKRNKDARLKDLLPPMLELTRGVWHSQARVVASVKPDLLIPKIAQAIDDGDWRTANRITMWLNTILGMDGFETDSARVTPDPLVLLDTDFVLDHAPRNLAALPPAELPSYRTATSDLSATAVAWYDIDFDLQYDVVAGVGTDLVFLKQQDSTLQPLETLAVGKRFTGITPIDLFRSEAPSAPKLPISVSELMLKGSTAIRSKPDKNSTKGIVGARPRSLQELLLWGPDGFAVVSWTEDGFLLLDTQTGLEAFRDVTLVQAADIESDGDLDLLIVASGAIRLVQNNGNRTFREITEFSQLPPASTQIHSVVGFDFDRDLDQDFVLQTDAGLAVLENQLHTQFRYRLLNADRPNSADHSGLAVGDFDNNRSWDFASVGPGGSSVAYTITPAPRQIATTRVLELPEVNGSQVAAEDLNCDGHLDLVVASSSGLSVFAGQPDGSFAASKQMVGGATSQLAPLDCDYDGNVDLLMLADGHPTLLSAAPETPKGNFAVVRTTGIYDNNGGGRINHYCLGSTLEVWSDSRLRSRLVQSPVTHFGFGELEPENLRIVFTNGLTQNAEELAANTLIEEKQLLRGSCPYLYGWDGEKFVLITDLLWNAPLGLQVAEGITAKDRRWEHLMLPGDLLQAKDGVIELRITEELWEIAYFDHIRLTAVDHAPDVEVFTNEKAAPAELAQPQMFTAKRRLAAKSARDAHGRDWTETLAKRDRNFAQAFEYRICQGLCEPHFIELDFGRLPVDDPELRLFLNGWLFPTDTSLNIGISQNPDRPSPEMPSLWVVDENGQWVRAIESMGYPGGKPKSIVVGLQGVFQSDDHRLRIAASQELYWDQAFVSWDNDAEQLRETVLELDSAQLAYRGFSAPMDRDADQPHWFDYTQVSKAPNWPPLEGPFTRYGDVRQILQQDDDQMVVITSGDEMRLRFTVPNTPLPEGWRRDYVLHSTGWDKDADINTIKGQGSLPLPFMAQQDYPAPLDQLDAANAVLKKNAATLTRHPSYQQLRYPAPTHAAE